MKAVLHDAQIVDECGNPTGAEGLFANRGSRKGILKNLVKNSYVGCCMAFRRGADSCNLSDTKRNVHA